MNKVIFPLTLLACILLADLPCFEANNDVIVNKCSEEESKKKDMSCAHMFLEKMKNSSANCGHELMNFMSCIRNFTLGKCYGDYLKLHHNMMEPMRRMADMKAKMHNFGRLLCGIDDPGINTTGLPEKIKDMMKCKKEFFDKGKDCAKSFHDKFKASRESKDLCKLFMEAKMCHGGLMKKYCTFSKPPPRDPFNPFCPDQKDPNPHAGAGKLYTSVALAFMGIAVFLLL